MPPSTTKATAPAHQPWLLRRLKTVATVNPEHKEMTQVRQSVRRSRPRLSAHSTWDGRLLMYSPSHVLECFCDLGLALLRVLESTNYHLKHKHTQEQHEGYENGRHRSERELGTCAHCPGGMTPSCVDRRSLVIR